MFSATSSVSFSACACCRASSLVSGGAAAGRAAAAACPSGERATYSAASSAAWTFYSAGGRRRSSPSCCSWPREVSASPPAPVAAPPLSSAAPPLQPFAPPPAPPAIARRTAPPPRRLRSSPGSHSCHRATQLPYRAWACRKLWLGEAHAVVTRGALGHQQRQLLRLRCLPRLLARHRHRLLPATGRCYGELRSNN
eukprot:scaffold5029_cov63-Phaeocystis_antarctica.AAC.1